MTCVVIMELEVVNETFLAGPRVGCNLGQYYILGANIKGSNNEIATSSSSSLRQTSPKSGRPD
jgi:hypothetical protein